MSKHVRQVIFDGFASENRKWRVPDIEKLFRYFATVPDHVGDITVLAFKSQGKIKDLAPWEKKVRNKLRMLRDTLEVEKRQHLRLNIVLPLIKACLQDSARAIYLARNLKTEHRRSL